MKSKYYSTNYFNITGTYIILGLQIGYKITVYIVTIVDFVW